MLLVLMLVLSVTLLAMLHFIREPSWISEYLPAVEGGDGILWQVQSTFLSVGFAALAIAAQLFAETPLAIGASRARVLEFIWAGWFVGVGLAANAAIAIEVIWLPSNFGVMGVALFWFVPTVVLLVVATVRLMRLFGRPSLLDEVVRESLVGTVSNRLEASTRKYAEAQKQLDGLISSDFSLGSLRAATMTLRVPVPQVGRIIKAIKPRVLRRALDSLGPRATEDDLESGNPVVFTPPKITFAMDPGDRTRLGQTAFRVSTSHKLDQAGQSSLIRLLQSSIEFEPSGTVTPYEETDRDIASLKDAIGINLRSGAFATAERALELLGHMIRGVWMADPENVDTSRRASFARRDWLFRSIGEVEQGTLLSPRAADLFVSAAMNRALEAPRTGSAEYVDECLRSFTRIWNGVLQRGGHEFNHLPNRIVTCVQNLAAYSYPTTDQRKDFTAHATWAMVELVKLALDAKRPDVATLAAGELNGLFQYSDPSGIDRVHVRAGQLVLSGWLGYLAEKGGGSDPADSRLRALVTPDGTLSEILAARSMTERGMAPFTRWDWWETKHSLSGEAQILELPHYIDRAGVDALASSYGPLPPANDDETASEYRRFLRLLDEDGGELSGKAAILREEIAKAIGKWDEAEGERLAAEPLSGQRLETLRSSLQETLDTEHRLTSLIPVSVDIPDSADKSKPILGMNLRVPRHYLVDKVFNQTYADPGELGRVIARGFTDGEEHKVVDQLRALQKELLDPSARAILNQINTLGRDAGHYVLLTPYGGLPDLEHWYSVAFREALARVTHIETAMLHEEVILFDRRATLFMARKPEAKDGLIPVGETSVALGVFEDVQDADEPLVRIETGEYFVVWTGAEPRVFRFATSKGEEADKGSRTEPTENALVQRRPGATGSIPPRRQQQDDLRGPTRQRDRPQPSRSKDDGQVPNGPQEPRSTPDPK